jgi:hypothetical protein
MAYTPLALVDELIELVPPVARQTTADTETLAIGSPVAAFVTTPLIEPPVSRLKFRPVDVTPKETGTGVLVASAAADWQNPTHGTSSQISLRSQLLTTQE